MNNRTPPTTDKLRIAIDREGQGDKVDFPDPAAAPLGTDAEASGNSPRPDELALEPVAEHASAKGGWTGLTAYVLIASLAFGAILAIVIMA
jgi:hypothetical protein